MKCLFLDIASHKGLLALTSDSEVLSSIEVDHKISDGELVSQLEELLTKGNISYQDLTHVACVIGPGGFTSLRVAVTCANVLADQLNIPLAPIHLSDLYHARSADAYWFHSTKKTELFVRGGKWNEPTLITLDNLKSELSSNPEWMGELLPEHEAQLSLKSAPLKDLKNILPVFLKILPYQKKSLEPWYGRGW